MDMMNGIAALAMDMKAAQFQQDYAMAVQSKVMDTMDMAGQEILDLMPDQTAIQFPKGEFIDVYA